MSVPVVDAASGAMAAPPRSVLVVVTRRIGDVLLATPLIRSLKAAWPQAAVDALVLSGTEGVLAANPDVRRILAVPARPARLWHIGFLLRLRRRYDLALSLLNGSRPTLYASLAGHRSIGLQLAEPGGAWRRRLLDGWVPFDNLNTHTVLMHLALADALGVPRRAEVVAAWSGNDEQQADAVLGAQDARPLAVLHPFPKYRYKMWRPECWIEVAPLSDTGKPVGDSYVFYDVNYEPDTPVPVLFWTARNWPSPAPTVRFTYGTLASSASSLPG